MSKTKQQASGHQNNTMHCSEHCKPVFEKNMNRHKGLGWLKCKQGSTRYRKAVVAE